MNSSLSTVPAAKLLVSIFSALHPVTKVAKIKGNTCDQVMKNLESIMPDISLTLPLNITLADQYAEIFSYILSEVNDDDLKEYAEQKAMHAANFGRNGSNSNKNKFHEVERMTVSKRIKIAKTVIDDMEQAGIFSINKPLMNIIK